MRVERFLAWATAQLWFIGSSLCLPSSINVLMFGCHVLGILLISWLSVFAICCRLPSSLTTGTLELTVSLEKKISRQCCRLPYWSNSKLFRASHQLFKSLESMRHRTAGPLSPSQPCGLIQLPWNSRGECSCHRKLKQVTDSHMNRITRLCSITHDARAQMYSWKSADVELFQRSTNEWQHSRLHCPIHTHGGMNSGGRCGCFQTSDSLNIYIFETSPGTCWVRQKAHSK